MLLTVWTATDEEEWLVLKISTEEGPCQNVMGAGMITINLFRLSLQIKPIPSIASNCDPGGRAHLRALPSSDFRPRPGEEWDYVLL